MNIIKLLDSNKWNKIYDYLKKGDFTADTILLNNNNIGHLAAQANNNQVIEWIIKHKPSLLSLSGNDGDTIAHILAKNKFVTLLNKVLDYDNSLAYFKNDENESVVYLLEPDIIKKHGLSIDSNGKNNNGMTKLLSLISNRNYDAIKKTINTVKNLNVPEEMPPLIFSIMTKQPKIANLLLEEGADPNVKNKKYLTPLFFAVSKQQEEIVKLLLEKGADPNDSGAEGDENPLTIAIGKLNSNLANILLNNGANVNKMNRYMNTPMHMVLLTKKPVKTTMINKFIYLADMNIQNIKGDTPLHLLFRRYAWKNFSNVLENKKLNIFIKNDKGDMPIHYISNKEFPFFMDLIATSFLNNMRKDKVELKDSRCDREAFIKERCLSHIKKYIKKNKRSFPKKDTDISSINMIEILDSNKGSFNADTVHSFIYTVQHLEKYDNLTLPFQYYHNDISVNDHMELSLNVVRDNTDKTLDRLISAYTGTFFELAPMLIAWSNNDQYHIHQNFGYHFHKTLLNKSRFVFVKITVVNKTGSSHANCLMFDKKKCILERFEPYGVVSYLSNSKMDELLKEKFSVYLKDYLQEKEMKLTYISPKEMMGDISFQTISSDSIITVRKLGDPGGYCLAWVMWFVELRLKNPDTSSKDLVINAKKEIMKLDGNHKFIDYIRNYASVLDKRKNKFLESVGISSNYYYKMMFTEKEYQMIFDGLIKKLLKKQN